MLFFKPKPKFDEILPPPPPFPAMDFEEKRSAGVQTEPGLAGISASKPKQIGLKPAEKPKPIKSKISSKKAKAEKIKKNAALSRQPGKKGTMAAEIGFPEELELPGKLDDFKLEDFNIDDLEKEIDIGKEIDIPENFGQETVAKANDIAEAEEEIKSAIEKIKKQEKPSFFRGLFAKKEKPEENPDAMAQEIPQADKLSAIQNNISKAREALMKFDLEAAKKDYIEIMKAYNNLQLEEQAKVYNDIRDLYFERKSAEELKV